MYNINDFVVYKKDVCKIKNITIKNNTEYYVMEPIDDNSLKIQIPINADNIFLRNLKTKNEIESLIKNIPNISIIENGDKMIENEYKRLLDTGTFEDLIKIIKTTYLRNKERMDNKKKMSDKDSIYFEKAERYLYNEIATVFNMSYEETKNYVINTVKNLDKQKP